ncbi:MAG: hypothetical protein WKF36_10605 [Candidatus Nitrosocosmicus sp.]
MREKSCRKNERTIPYIKDRTEGFDDYFLWMFKNIKLEMHVIG